MWLGYKMFKFIVLIGMIFMSSFEVLALDLEKINFLIKNSARPFNGIVLIAENNTIVYEKVYGEYGNPKINNQFIIGSISKQITAAILLKLVDGGLVDLNAPITQYLPDLNQNLSTVKVRHLLNHTSGIVDLNKPLEFESGSTFKYSPIIGYHLASKIAEKVTHKSYMVLLDEILKEAGMHHSGLTFSEDLSKNYAAFPLLSHSFKENEQHVIQALSILGEEEQRYDSSWNAGGGIISTAYDLLAWNLALHEGHLLSSKIYPEMITPTTTREHPRYGSVGYGFGIQVSEKDNILELSHSGYIDGYISTVLYYPKQKTSIIILENVSWNIKDVKRAFSIHDQIRDIFREGILGLKGNQNKVK